MAFRAQHTLPLVSSDAFTGFGLPTDSLSADGAIQYYLHEYLPKHVMSEHLLKTDWSAAGHAELTRMLHARGVNMRHLGVVRALVPADHPQTESLRQLLLQEMVRRALKSLVREKMRLSLSQASDASTITASDVLTRLKSKFGALVLNDADEGAVTALLASAGSVTESALGKEVQADLSSVTSDVVVVPDFPTADQAEQRFLDELSLRERTVGALSPLLLPTMELLLNLYRIWHRHNVADTAVKANKLIERIISIIDRDEKAHGSTLISCGMFYSKTGSYKRALELFKRAAAIAEAANGPTHRSVATAYGNMATILSKQGHLPESLSYHNKALAIELKVLGESHPAVATTYGNLALVYGKQGLFEKALQFHQKELAIELIHLKPDHPHIATTYGNMALALRKQGKFAEALRYHEMELAIELQQLGPEHPDVGTTYGNMALVFSKQGRLTEALEYQEKDLAIELKTLGPNHPSVAITYGNIATLYSKMGRLEESLQFHQKDLEITTLSMGEDHPLVATTYGNIALVLRKQGKLEESLEYHKKELDIELKKLGADHPDVATTYYNMAVLFKRMHKPVSEIRKAFEEALRICRITYGENHSETKDVLEELAKL